MNTKSFTLNNKELLLVEQPIGLRTQIHMGYKLIGKLSEVTEGKFVAIVNGTGSDALFVDYNKNPSWIITAKESFFSKLEAEGIAFENKESHPGAIDPTSRSHYDKLTAEWQSAQEKVFNIDNTYLFEKV